jgi:hypothetical protein
MSKKDIIARAQRRGQKKTIFQVFFVIDKKSQSHEI